MALHATAIDLLSEYVYLQSALCTKLAKEYGIVDDSDIVFTVPKFGRLVLRHEDWSFVRHGQGVRFKRDVDSNVVDATNSIVSHPDALDAWRLIEHFESMNIQQLVHDNISFDVRTNVGLTDLLEALSKKGLLTEFNKSTGLYIFAGAIGRPL